MPPKGCFDPVGDADHACEGHPFAICSVLADFANIQGTQVKKLALNYQVVILQVVQDDTCPLWAPCVMLFWYQWDGLLFRSIT